MNKFFLSMVLTIFCSATITGSYRKSLPKLFLPRPQAHCFMINHWAKFPNIPSNTPYLNAEKILYWLTAITEEDHPMSIKIVSDISRYQKSLSLYKQDNQNSETVHIICRNFDEKLSIFQLLHNQYQNNAAAEYTQRLYPQVCKLIQKRQCSSLSAAVLHAYKSGTIILENDKITQRLS